MVRFIPLAMALACAGAASAQPVTLTAHMTADNEFEAFISTDNGVRGQSFLAGNNWWTTYAGSASLPGPGTYYLHVRAVDWSGPRMFIGRFTLNSDRARFANGTPSLVTGTAHWQVSATGWSGYGPVQNFGANGSSPWGTFTDMPGASFIWGNETATPVYFTTAIEVLSTCAADVNRDGTLDFFDYLDFVAAFSVEDPSADFNSDGEVDFFDYLDFVAAFSAGCN